MHSNLQFEMYRAMAADRVHGAHGAVVPRERQHPPPVRGRAAYAAARLARRIDSESARRAIA
jgi:hypothetical protein